MIKPDLCYLLLWEKDEQPLHGHVRKDGFRFRGCSREMDVILRAGKGQEWRARWGLRLLHLEGRHTGGHVMTPAHLVRWSYFLAHMLMHRGWCPPGGLSCSWSPPAWLFKQPFSPSPGWTPYPGQKLPLNLSLLRVIFLSGKKHRSPSLIISLACRAKLSR